MSTQGWRGPASASISQPTSRLQEALRAAVRTVLDRPAYRLRASQMADEFARIDTRSEILSIISQVVDDEKALSGRRPSPRRVARQRS